MRTKNQAPLDRYDTFLALQGNECVVLGKPVFDLATDLRANQGLKTSDALHLAAAIQTGCNEF